MSDDAPPPPDSKLTRTKRRWADEGRFLTGGPTPATDRPRLPPGQHLVRDWPVLDLGVTPRVAADRWTLRVFGLVSHPFTWDWAAFRAQPQRRARTDMHCVTTWSRFDNDWAGVSTAAVLAAAEPKEEATYVLLHAHDNYTTNLPLADFAAPDAMLVHSWDNRPLTPEHGGPVRLLVPHLYLWKSAKWLRAVEFRAADKPGFWEGHGYHDRGDPWTEQRYAGG